MRRIVNRPPKEPAVGSAHPWIQAGATIGRGQYLGFSLTGQIPSGKNAMLVDPRTGRHYPARRFIAWRTEMLPSVPNIGAYTTPVRLEIDYYPGDLRRRDVSGMTDALLHLLEKAGILKDDSLVVELEFLTKPLMRKSPKVDIRIYRLPS